MNNQHLNDWANVHDAYRNSLEVGAARQSRNVLKRRSAAWSAEKSAMPNGHLISENSFFKSHGDKKIYLLHATAQIDAIKQSKSIHSSAGCLVGAIYCAQVFKDESTDMFRTHNLGDYIINREVHNYIKSKKEINKKQGLMLFEIDVPEDCNTLQAGINYLKFGNIHYKLYSQLSYLLSQDERQQLEGEVVGMIKKSIPFLMHAEAIFAKNHLTYAEASNFIRHVNEAGKNLPMLSYLYFEALSEYLMLASKDKKTRALAELGEFNNYLYKDMMYDMYTKMNGNFTLSKFNPTEQMIEHYVKNSMPADSDIDLEACIIYVARRVAFLIQETFYNGATNWQTVHYTIDGLAKSMAPLIGHLIHRILRSFGRYSDFYFYFDSMKALEVWNYWNSQDILFPFNGVIPKGEVGINPSYPNLSYKVYEAEKVGKNSVKVIEEIDVKIVPRLVNLEMSFLRASGKYALTKKAADV